MYKNYFTGHRLWLLITKNVVLLTTSAVFIVVVVGMRGSGHLLPHGSTSPMTSSDCGVTVART